MVSKLLPVERESVSERVVTPGAIFSRTEVGGLVEVERFMRVQNKGAMICSQAAVRRVGR